MPCSKKRTRWEKTLCAYNHHRSYILDRWIWFMDNKKYINSEKFKKELAEAMEMAEKMKEVREKRKELAEIEEDKKIAEKIAELIKEAEEIEEKYFNETQKN